MLRGLVLVVRETSDERPFLLATLPPSQGQIRLARGVVVALVVAFGVTAPFMRTQLPSVNATIPVFETAILVNDLITSALLLAQFLIVRRWSLLVLASGYLFTALIVIPHALIFPGAFTPTGLFNAGLQSSAWLYTFWHAGLPLATIAYVLLRDADGGTIISERSLVAVIGLSVAAVIAVVCGLTWIATLGDWFLPRIFLDNVHADPSRIWQTGAVDLSLTAVALALLWLRRRSVLDLWLMVMCCTWLLELTMTAIFLNTRFSLGWYASRIYALTATMFILIVLLSETTALYAHLARSVMRRRGDREDRQIAMDAMAASIAHEVNQPLGAIVANTESALVFLAKTPPDIGEARAALEDIAINSARGSEVIASLRAMFRKDVHGRVWFDINALIREALTLLDIELRTQRVSVSTELRDDIPRLFADRGQLQQVILNLVVNAIEAMHSVTDRTRELRITSDIIQNSSDVLVTIEDSGAGLHRKDKDRIFEPFFTTKSTGTGIGFTICRSIIEAHGGNLQATANNPYGAIFRLALPIEYTGNV
jgi:signal transduction histidine kinase